MSTEKAHPTTSISGASTDTLENQPMELRTKNRLYTTTDQRQRLGITHRYGRGTNVAVVVGDVQRNEEYTVVRTAAFETRLRYYGEIGVPQPVVDELDLEVGDTLRVKITRLDEVEVNVTTTIQS